MKLRFPHKKMSTIFDDYQELLMKMKILFCFFKFHIRRLAIVTQFSLRFLSFLKNFNRNVEAIELVSVRVALPG
jgi:hypothetical protein